MDRSDSLRQPDDREELQRERPVEPQFEGISPLNPSTFPRAEDDAETFEHSSDFHDMPDPGPNAGKAEK